MEETASGITLEDSVRCGICGAGPADACQKTDRWGECLVNVNLSKIDRAAPSPGPHERYLS